MTTYEPGQPVWLLYDHVCDWVEAHVVMPKYGVDYILVDVRGRIRVVPASVIRPRDPSQNGKDKPNE